MSHALIQTALTARLTKASVLPAPLRIDSIWMEVPALCVPLLTLLSLPPVKSALPFSVTQFLLMANVSKLVEMASEWTAQPLTSVTMGILLKGMVVTVFAQSSQASTAQEGLPPL